MDRNIDTGRLKCYTVVIFYVYSEREDQQWQKEFSLF